MPISVEPQSVLEAVTEYVQETLKAASDLEGVKILWGPPTGDDTPAEFIAVGFGMKGESGESDRQWVTIGGGQLDETFSIELMSHASGANGTDLKPAYRRSYQIANAAEAAIRVDISMDGLLLKPAHLSHLRGRYVRGDQVRGHQVFQTLTGTARI